MCKIDHLPLQCLGRSLMNVGQVENHISPIFVHLVVLIMNMYLEKNVKNLMFNLLIFFIGYGEHDGVKGYYLYNIVT
jgi:hypothetical protein